MFDISVVESNWPEEADDCRRFLDEAKTVEGIGSAKEGNALGAAEFTEEDPCVSSSPDRPGSNIAKALAILIFTPRATLFDISSSAFWDLDLLQKHSPDQHHCSSMIFITIMRNAILVNLQNNVSQQIGQDLLEPVTLKAYIVTIIYYCKYT